MFRLLAKQCDLTKKKRDEGAAKACSLAATMARDGEGTTKKLENALHFWDRACAMGDTKACDEAGMLLGGPLPNPPLRALDDADGTRADSYFARGSWDSWFHLLFSRRSTREKYCALPLQRGRERCLAALEAELDVIAQDHPQERCYQKWSAILRTCETVSFPACDEFPPRKNGWAEWRCSGVLGVPVEGPPIFNKGGEEEP
jgi:TPR repeat protein